MRIHRVYNDGVTSASFSRAHKVHAGVEISGDTSFMITQLQWRDPLDSFVQVLLTGDSSSGSSVQQSGSEQSNAEQRSLLSALIPLICLFKI